MIDFAKKPVIKVECGDGHSGLLTANGEVYTWGKNDWGALGINSSEIFIQLSPSEPLKFKNNMRITDISCGLNTMLAMTDEGKVFGWGRRMGVYPTIELTLDQLDQRGHIYNIGEIH